MREKMSTKAIGFYFIVLAGIVAIISTVRFLMWAPKHDAMDMVVVVALVIGIITDVILMVKDNDYLVILATVFYSIGVVKMLTDSVGSFVDAIQGIKMFGDSSQVGTIISISSVMAISIILSIVASFLKRINE